MKRGKVTQFIIAGLIILILLIQRNVNADKKECEKAIDLAEQGAKNNIKGYKESLERQNNILKGLQSKNLEIIERNLPYIKNNPERLADVKEHLEIMNKLDPGNMKVIEQTNIVRNELNKFLMPKASEIKGLKEGDILHGIPQKNLLNILDSGYLKTSMGVQGEGVYYARVLKNQNDAIGLTRRVTPGEVPIIFRIKRENFNPKELIDISKGGYQGKIPRDVLIKNVEIYDPIKKAWIDLEYVNKNKDKFKYLF